MVVSKFQVRCLFIHIAIVLSVINCKKILVLMWSLVYTGTKSWF